MYELLTWRSELVREILEKLFSSKISYGPEKNDGPNKSGMSQDHTFVSGKFADAVGEHHVVPMVLRNIEGTRKLI